MPRNFETFSHTADIGLKVRGETIAALFENAALGLTSLLTDPEKIHSEKKVAFKLKSSVGWESLLVEWLQEILYEFTVRKMAFSKFHVQRISEYFLEAEADGELIQSDRHPILREVKAVTYHNLKIDRDKEGFRTEIIIDI